MDSSEISEADVGLSPTTCSDRRYRLCVSTTLGDSVDLMLNKGEVEMIIDSLSRQIRDLPPVGSGSPESPKSELD